MSHDNYVLMLPYKAGAISYLGTSVVWESFTLVKRKMQVGSNELMQYVTDISTPLLFLYVADNIINIV